MKGLLIAVAIFMIPSHAAADKGSSFSVSVLEGGKKGVKSEANSFDVVPGGYENTTGKNPIEKPVVLVGIQPHTCAPVLSAGGRGGRGVPLDLAFSDSTSNCLSFSALPPVETGSGPDPATLSPQEVAAIAADKAMALAASPRLEMAPAAVGLTGLATYFWLAEEPTTVSATAVVPGFEVTAEATPVQYAWGTGDGGQVTTAGPGRVWRRGRPGNISHVYERRGSYEVEVTVVWFARWRIGTGPWRDLGYFANSDSTTYPVRQVRAALTESRT